MLPRALLKRSYTGFRSAALILLCLSLLVGLAAFAYAGTYARYWADDYCYSAAVKQAGLIQGIADWYRTSGNRLSTLVVVWVSEMGGPRAIQTLPGLLLALTAASWAVFLRALARRLYKADLVSGLPSGLWTAALSLLMTFYTFLLAPDRLQTLYWRMGSLHYALPAALLLLNLALLLRATESPSARWWVGLASALLAFFTAGLSETFAALQAALFLLWIAAAWIGQRQRERWQRWNWLPLAGTLAAPLAGTLAMMLVMASAPANAWRQAALPPPVNLLDVPLYAMRYAADFIFYALRGAPLPFLAFLATITGLGLLLPEPRLSARSMLGGGLISLVGAYLLVAASFAPSAFAGLAYPAGRAQMPGQAALLVGLAGAAFFLSCATRRAFTEARPAWVNAAALVLLLASALYPVRALSAARADVASQSGRAERWDERTAQILDARAAGETDLLVRQTDVVQSLEDIGPDPDFWINRCAADYFGVRNITAQP